MRILSIFITFLLLTTLLMQAEPARAVTSNGVLEQAMSDTLDLWREGQYEQLYDHLAHRGKTSREQFANSMRNTTIRPACCFQKLENFRVLNEKRTEATVYAKVGLEGSANASESSTREFKLTHEGNVWKMQLADVFSIAGVTGKKKRHSTYKNSSSYK
jgi:hypothetical protein